MKHVTSMTKGVPALAFCTADHPDLKDSITGFLEDPMGTLQLHLNKDNAS